MEDSSDEVVQREETIRSAGERHEPCRVPEFFEDVFSKAASRRRDEITALAAAITPHSFRAGMASDLQRLGIPV